MHNSPRKNLEFEITFAETNLRWLQGENPPNGAKIRDSIAKIKELKNKLSKLSD